MKYDWTEDIKFLKDVMGLNEDALMLIEQMLRTAYVAGKADQANTSYEIVKK